MSAATTDQTSGNPCDDGGDSSPFGALAGLKIIDLSRVLGVNSFPSLRLEHDGHIHPIPVNYRDHHPTLEEIQRTLAKK